MSKTKLIITIVITAIIIDTITLWLFYMSLGKDNIINKITENIGWVTKVVSKKVIEEKLEEYRQIKDLQSDITKAIDKSSASVVSIVVSKDLQVYYEDPYNFFGGYVTERKEKIWWGSWIIVASDGYIITNKHVVVDTWADYTVLTKDWDTYKVSNIWLDPVLDIAVLKIVDENWNIPSNLKSASVTSVDNNIQVWQFTIAIWNALAEFQNTTTFWIISWKWRQLQQAWNNSVYIWLYQTDTAINPWNSWWPLLDINWDVIWINTAISAVGQWIWFSIPINKEFVKATLETIKTKSKIIRPFIWINYLDLDKSIAKSQKVDKFEWVLVQDVVKWSPANIAWLEKWDIIIDINWKKIDNNNNFLYDLYTYVPWEKIELTVYSKKDYRKVEVTLWENKF